MERRMGLPTDVIRFLTIRVDEHETEPSIQMRKSDRDDRRDGDRGGFAAASGGFRGGDAAAAVAASAAAWRRWRLPRRSGAAEGAVVALPSRTDGDGPPSDRARRARTRPAPAARRLKSMAER